MYLLAMLIFSGMFAMNGGLGAFEVKTPYKNRLTGTGTGLVQFSFSGPVPDSVRKQTGRVAFRKFYFYKGHVIGRDDTAFYVIDEAIPEVIRFYSQDVFESYLVKHRLKPGIWTRWYDWHYDEANFKWIGFFATVMFPLTLLLVCLYLYSLYSLLMSEKKMYKILKQVYVGSISLFLLVAFLMQSFPQSI